MRHYERLAEQVRLSRRTIVVLREFAGFQADDHAEIRIALLKLPSADVVGLFDLEFATPVCTEYSIQYGRREQTG